MQKQNFGTKNIAKPCLNASAHHRSEHHKMMNTVLKYKREAHSFDIFPSPNPTINYLQAYQVFYTKS